MTVPNPSPDKFVRLSRPPIPVVKLTAEHDADTPPVSTGEWERLARPALLPVTLVSGPVEPTPTKVTPPVFPEGDARTPSAG